MKCKIYATDEGFGPLVRQSAVIEELRALAPDIEITFQTHRHVDDARWILKGVSLVDRYNNIEWNKHADGSPDVPAIRRFLSDYETRSERFIRRELDEFDHDFVISDFVYEAFPIARRNDAPAFGVAHFTWDWFFSMLDPVPVGGGLLERFWECAAMADVLYFPPFTPHEILAKHDGRVKQVPLVVRKHESSMPEGLDSTKFEVLVIDSGSELLHEQMRRSLRDIGELAADFHFFLSADLGVEGENVTEIHDKEFFIDHIPHVDLVIGRAGFNTISECIAFRTPMLLVGEAMNPEMVRNMENVKRLGLGSFVSLDRFTGAFNELLPTFVQREYDHVLRMMRSHEIPTDGARVIAQDILERVRARAPVS